MWSFQHNNDVFKLIIMFPSYLWPVQQWNRHIHNPILRRDRLRWKLLLWIRIHFQWWDFGHLLGNDELYRMQHTTRHLDLIFCLSFRLDIRWAHSCHRPLVPSIWAKLLYQWLLQWPMSELCFGMVLEPFKNFLSDVLVHVLGERFFLMCYKNRSSLIEHAKNKSSQIDKIKRNST